MFLTVFIRKILIISSLSKFLSILFRPFFGFITPKYFKSFCFRMSDYNRTWRRLYSRKAPLALWLYTCIYFFNLLVLLVNKNDLPIFDRKIKNKRKDNMFFICTFRMEYWLSLLTNHNFKDYAILTIVIIFLFCDRFKICQTISYTL